MPEDGEHDRKIQYILTKLIEFLKVWFPRCVSRIHIERRNVARQCTTLL